MAILNIADIEGIVLKSDKSVHANGVEEQVAAVAIIRGYRHIGDNRETVKIDQPIVMSRNPRIKDKMAQWHYGTVVRVKGLISTRLIKKSHKCPDCGTVDREEGVLVYIEPIYVENKFNLSSKDESLAYLNSIREISNCTYIEGVVCKTPKMIRPKQKLIVTQYQLAIDRKYIVREDDPSIRKDYPWVKSYGQNAIVDKDRLHLGTSVTIDGCLQARNINRHAVCSACGLRYDWKDRALEIVPYETEYNSNFYSDTEVNENRQKRREDVLRNSNLSQFIINENTVNTDYDEITDDDIEAGYDTMVDED